MNKEVARINERELQLGVSGSWHDQYKDSAYVYIGNLPRDLTEGDVITIMSQYGEVMDVNLPRDKQTGKIRGFGFLMYEDQRSTVLAVDNLNGAKVLDRTIRVDHVSDYKQPKEKDADGDLVDRAEQSLNAKPELILDDGAGAGSSSEDDEPLPDIDPDDPMRDYLIQKFKEDRLKAKKKKSAKRANETPEERKERKRRKKEKKERERRAIEDKDRTRDRRRSPSPVSRRRDRSPDRAYERRDQSPDRRRDRTGPYDSHRRSRSRTPPARSRGSPPRRDYRD
ncbi:hypothetical protein AURDEDRAFT_185479 [Auricularia subglabra TFB-10046 SS5]|nr:hypothetical protein AURDEDRAFT_185479 [Auricularia subglabra TFB-10046 SS5]